MCNAKNEMSCIESREIKLPFKLLDIKCNCFFIVIVVILAVMLIALKIFTIHCG